MKGYQEGRAWRDVIHAEAKAMSNPPSAAEAGSHDPSTPAGTVRAWDPYDVWLKRVKQPRDRRIAGRPR